MYSNSISYLSVWYHGIRHSFSIGVLGFVRIFIGVYLIRNKTLNSSQWCLASVGSETYPSPIIPFGLVGESAGGMAPAPAPAPALFVLNFRSTGELMKLCLLILVIVVFIILILKDIVKALKRSAHWIPGDFLVLSAFTIQLLNLLSSQAQPLESNTKNTISWGQFWMTHTSRVMLCVIVAYLMPGMANPRAEESWGKLIALALTVFLNLSSEYYIVRRHGLNNEQSYYCSVSGCIDKGRINMTVYIVFASLISLCFVMLLLLLGSANIAGRGIERILAQKIPLLLKEGDDLYSELGAACSEERDFKYHCCWQTVGDAEKEHRLRHCHCQRCWQKVEDAVLRRWVVARAYSREYIIARSALVSSAATIVTVQIVITIVGGLRISPKLEISTVSGGLRFTATVLQCIFIFIGWSMIEWRWITAVAYYKKHLRQMLQGQKTPERDAEAQASWLKEFKVEDFWTRHLRELVQAQKPRLPQAELLDYKIKKTIAKEQTSFTVPRHLLYPVMGMQWVTVAFSKVCWLTSLIIFHNRYMDKLLLFILAKHDMHALEDYPKYKKMLEEVQMLRRHPESLWVANRKSITKARMLIIKGNEDGERMCENLIDLLARRRTDSRLGLNCLEPYNPQTPGLKFLCKKRPIQRRQQDKNLENQQSQEEFDEELGVEEHLIDAGTKSWKMTAVSLLTIIIHLAPSFAELEKKSSCSTSKDFPPKPVENCMKAYSQAWEIVDFVEETDTESDLNIMNETADRYFNSLQRKVKDMLSHASECGDTPPNQYVHATLKHLKEDCLSKTDPPGGVNMISAVVYALGIKQKKGRDGIQDINKRWMKVGGNDSVDWEAVAYGNAVYKLCNSIQFDGANVADVAELLEELERCLADIIYECLEKIQYLLLLNSKTWFQNTNDKRMGKALYTAGKARLIMKNLDTRKRGNDLAIVPI